MKEVLSHLQGCNLVSSCTCSSPWGESVSTVRQVEPSPKALNWISRRASRPKTARESDFCKIRDAHCWHAQYHTYIKLNSQSVWSLSAFLSPWNREHTLHFNSVGPPSATSGCSHITALLAGAAGSLPTYDCSCESILSSACWSSLCCTYNRVFLSIPLSKSF